VLPYNIAKIIRKILHLEKLRSISCNANNLHHVAVSRKSVQRQHRKLVRKKMKQKLDVNYNGLSVTHDVKL